MLAATRIVISLLKLRIGVAIAASALAGLAARANALAKHDIAGAARTLVSSIQKKIGK